MESHSFDTYSRLLGTASTRRATVGGSLAALLAAAFDTTSDVGAKHRHRKRKHKKKSRPKTVADAACAVVDDEQALGGPKRFAETFIAFHTGKLTRADFALKRNLAVGDLVVEIRDVNDQDEPDTVLATTSVNDVPPIGDGDPSLTVSAIFANPATVTAGHRYALSVSKALGNYFLQINVDSVTCPDGTLFFDLNATGNFVKTAHDMVFATFVTA